MVKRFLVFAAVSVVLSAARAVAEEAIIYEGEAGAGGPVAAGSWGSGMAKETSDQSYMGPKSLRIATEGYYAGARLDLKSPIDLSAFTGNPNSYLILALKPALPDRAQTTSTSSTTSSTSRGEKTETPDTLYTFPYPPGEEPAEAALPEGAQTSFRMERLRITLQTTDGFADAEDLDLGRARTDERGWKQLAVPLSFFKGKLGGKLQTVMVFGNTTDMFYLGEMKLATEPVVKISLQTGVDLYEAKVGDKITFTADASAGFAPLEIAWDFGISEGLHEDAMGEKVYNYYYKAGEYTVTCLVKDLTGAQEPLKRTLGVRVVK